MPENFQSFTITRPNMALQVLLYLMVGPSGAYLLANYHLSWIKLIFLITFFYPFISFTLSRYFLWSKTIQLYSDKLIIIKGKKSNTINFLNVKRYTNGSGGWGSGFGAWFIIINLSNSDKIQIIGDNKEMRNLISSFNSEMDQFIKTKFLPIERYDIDDEFSKRAFPIAAICAAIILILAILWMLRNGYDT